MTDIESLVKAVRLAWLKRIFSDNESTWKFHLLRLLRNAGGLLLFKCNYAMNELINSVFYRELLERWLEFRNLLLANKERLCIFWNNKDIRIYGKPVFYKSYYDSGVCIIKDLLFNLDNIESFNAINIVVEKANFLTWTGQRHAIPSILKAIEYTTFTENTYYYSLIISNKAQLPCNAKNSKRDCLQYKVLNSILYTNAKRFKILDISSMTKVLFARLNRKHYVTFSFTVSTQICCGKMLNSII